MLSTFEVYEKSKVLEKVTRFERTKRIQKHFPRREIVVDYIDQLGSTYLGDNKQKIAGTQKNCKFSMFSVDGWSKSCIFQLRTSQTIMGGIPDIFTQTDRSPDNIKSDPEAGLFSKIPKKFLQGNNITLYHTYTGSDDKFASHNPFAERVLQTVKSWLNLAKFDNIPDELQLDNTRFIHSTIKMTPEQASKPEIQKILSKIY